MPDILLDLRFLRYVMAAAQYGSFRRAASALEMQQSTLSRRIQLLENKLGVKLFERRGSGAKPTAAGQQFLREASIGAAYFERAMKYASALKLGEIGELRIGLFPSLGGGFLSNVLARFGKRYPAIAVHIEEQASDANIASVLNGDLDVAFVPGEPDVPGCRTSCFWSERVYIALPKEHHLADQVEVAWDQVRTARFVVSRGGLGTEAKDYLIKRLAHLTTRPEITVHGLSREGIMNLVALDYGLSITMESTTAMGYPGVVFRLLSNPIEDTPCSGVWSKDNVNPALKHLLATCCALADRSPR